MSPGQCRAARGLLDWTQEHLAEAAGVSRSTVRDFESSRHGLQRGSAAQIIEAFEKAGVRFIAAGDAGPGVRLASNGREPDLRSAPGQPSPQSGDAG